MNIKQINELNKAHDNGTKASKYLVYVFGQCIGQQFFTAQQVRQVERENTDIKLVNVHRYQIVHNRHGKKSRVGPFLLVGSLSKYKNSPTPHKYVPTIPPIHMFSVLSYNLMIQDDYSHVNADFSTNQNP